jgi:RNA polymerase sigma-70 factor (ECF subfamily)
MDFERDACQCQGIHGDLGQWELTCRFCLARDACHERVGRILNSYRGRLLALAQRKLSKRVQAKFAAADLVQSTLLEAWKDLSRFSGRTDREMGAWLRQILLNNVADVCRRLGGTAKRELSREISGVASNAGLALAASPAQDCPLRSAICKEGAESLHRTMAELPEDYRRVLVLRHFDALPYAVIGRQMQRTPEAVRKLWRSAIRRLKSKLTAAPLGSNGASPTASIH